jgi:hypothetical protein
MRKAGVVGLHNAYLNGGAGFDGRHGRFLPIVEDIFLATHEQQENSKIEILESQNRLSDQCAVRCVYSPSSSNTPAAVARIAITVPMPEKLRWRICASPEMMSQKAKSITPILLFIARSLSSGYLEF